MKINFGRLFDNKRFLMAFSVLMAMVAWFVVVNSIDKIGKRDISNISVDVTAGQDDVLTPINLNIVEGASVKVMVTIEGDRNVIGGVKASDLLITPDLSNVKEKGYYNNVELVGKDLHKKGFTIKSITPDTISLRIDQLTTKTFNIAAEVEGLWIPDGYLGQPTVINPKTVQITGPDADIQRIARCVVSASFTDPLTKTTSQKSDIKLFDAEGNELSRDLLVMDAQKADITVRVYKQKSLPVSFQFLDVPKGFLTDWLDYTLSEGSVDVAGPESVVDAIETLDIGYIPLNEVTKSNNMFVMDVSLTSGLINVSGTTKITVTFNLEDFEEANFTIPKENIIVKAKPVNYDVEIGSNSISNVHIIGDKKTMETLSAQDIVAEIDLLSGREVNPGPYTQPVKIVIPGGGNVWATGEYTCVINIKERESSEE